MAQQSLSRGLYTKHTLLFLFFSTVVLGAMLLSNRMHSHYQYQQQLHGQCHTRLLQLRSLMAEQQLATLGALQDSVRLQRGISLPWPAEIEQLSTELEQLQWHEDDPTRAPVQRLLGQHLARYRRSHHQYATRIAERAGQDTLHIPALRQYLAEELTPAYQQARQQTDQCLITLQQEEARIREDIDQTVSTLNWTMIAGIFLFAGLMLLYGYRHIRQVVSPLYKVRDYTATLSAGAVPDGELPTDLPNELGEISEALTAVADNHARVLDVLNGIGQGKLTFYTELLQNDEELGTALNALKAEMDRLQHQEKMFSYTLNGLAAFGDVLREHTELRTMAQELISRLAHYFRAQMGAFFLLEENDEQEAVLRMVASYAYHVQDSTPTFRLGEGLVGQAAAELETIYITDVPQNYTMASGLAETPPAALLIVPLVSGNDVFGIIELASLRRFEPHEIELAKKLAENIAAVVSNVKNNERSLQLLHHSQQMREELEQKSHQLQVQARRMLTTQQEIKEANRRMEKQMEQMNATARDLQQSERRIQTLLENASEIIAISEKDGRIRYISPSVKPILGYAPDQISTYTQFIHPEDLALYRDFLQNLLLYPDQTLHLSYRYQKRSGHYTWLESYGRNLIHEAAINGILINTRDISERIQAEKQNKRRLQFQSLTENSPDLITRYDTQGNFLYINPAIERFTGQQPTYYQGRSIHTVGYGAQEVAQWESLLRQAANGRQNYTTEVTMPSILGDRVMRTDVIPEMNEKGEIDSILVVSHDITEIRQAEIRILQQNQKLEQVNRDMAIQAKELSEKNQDITESITYAKRIQESILPPVSVLRNVFPQLCLLFRPRDIVSGDFYFYTQRGEDHYLAVVDCTGHGVPGAFMSLIGYNSLHQVINEHGITEPADILTIMDATIQSTLQRDQGGSKDGMDMALIKVNFQRRTLQYAGAMRPALWWHQYELHEIRGTRHSIGGDSLRAAPTVFEEHTLRIDPGDTLYLFSDGITDQFGGPGTKKYTTSRLRETLIRNMHKRMDDQEALLEKHFNDWKGQTPQTDDVLLIGIRF